MYFSPLRDEKIPADVDGLIFYGGYPELYAEKLSRNSSMRDSVRMALKEGLPCIGECGGFLYLQEYLETKEGQRFPHDGGITRREPLHRASLKIRLCDLVRRDGL